MDFFEVLGKMAVILFTIAAGYGANRLGYLGGETDQKLSKLLLNITMPALILSSVLNGDNRATLSEILSLLWVSVVFYGIAFAFALLVPCLIRGNRDEKGAWRFALAFANVAFIGYPVAVALFGPSSLFYAAILVLPCNLLSYTLGPLMLAGAKRFRWQQLLSPCVVAAVVSLLCVLADLRPPAMIGEILDFLGSVTVPFSLLVIGSLLASLPARQMLTSPKIWLLSAVRLLVMPAVLYFALRPMGLQPMILGIAVTQMAMPVAINGTLMSMEYGGDTEALAQVTFLTTVVSIVTIPLIAALFL